MKRLPCISRLWTDEDNRKLVLDHYPWFLDTYDALPKPVMKADSVRYLYMHHLGGTSHATAHCLHVDLFIHTGVHALPRA